MEKAKFTLSSSPHLHDKASTASIMWDVSLALTPAALWGIYLFGLRALLILVVSIASSMLVEYLLNLKKEELTLKDGSAFLTGLLLGMNFSVDTAIVVPIIASAFAIFVIKWSFGGLGSNWVNPALGGRVFVFFSFTGLMNTYRLPRTLKGIDTLSSASFLTEMKILIGEGAVTGLKSPSILASINYPFTDFAGRVSTKLTSIFKIGPSPYTVDAFFGNMAGTIGEVSVFLLLIGALYLLIKKIITWHIPVSFIGTFALLAWAFGGLRNGLGLFQGDFVLQIFSGGLILGAFFMATDMVTSPLTTKGMVIFGVGIGFFTFLLRYFGSLPEAVSLAIILMNIFVPTIDRYIKVKKFGEVVKEAK